MYIDENGNQVIKNNMPRIFRVLYNCSLAFGMDPKKLALSFRGLVPFLGNFLKLRHQANSSGKQFLFGELYPCLDDRFAESGIARGHYFYQDWLVASRIFENKPEIHIDVGSRVDGFVAHVASFRPIQVIDIRPLKTDVPNISFIQADVTSMVSTDLIGCCDSLSCLHTLEHFGLGRYGDSVNYNGHLTGLDNLSLLLRPNGKFYLSVPIGKQRIEYNAHRVFSMTYLLELFDGRFVVDNFSFVDDDGDLHMNVALTAIQILTNCNCEYGCGIFEMRKQNKEN